LFRKPTASRQAEGAAGGVAAREGALGQGTANLYGQKVRAGAMKEMAGQELGYTKLLSEEQGKYAETALKEGRFQTTEARLSRGQEISAEQFQQTLTQRKSEFDQTFGLEKSTNYMNQLLEMSVDNPTLSAKLSDYLLTGKSGAVGEFTDAEITEIKAAAEKAKAREGQVENIYDLVLANLEKELTGGNVVINPGETTASGTTAGQTGQQTATYEGVDIKSMDKWGWEKLLEDEPAIQQLDKAGVIYTQPLPVYKTMEDFLATGLQTDKEAGEGGGSIVIQNGTPYRLVGAYQVHASGIAIEGLNLLTNQKEGIILPPDTAYRG